MDADAAEIHIYRRKVNGLPHAGLFWELSMGSQICFQVLCDLRSYVMRAQYKGTLDNSENLPAWGESYALLESYVCSSVMRKIYGKVSRWRVSH